MMTVAYVYGTSIASHRGRVVGGERRRLGPHVAAAAAALGELALDEAGDGGGAHSCAVVAHPGHRGEPPAEGRALLRRRGLARREVRVPAGQAVRA